MSYAAKKAAEIDGWMEPAELEWLARQASARHRILEVGCWKGRSTKALALSTPGSVFAIDAWDKTLDDPEGTYGEALERGWAAIYTDFLANLMYERESGKVKIARCPFQDSDGILANESFNMIFIDGDHRYEAVKRDIAISFDLAESGALLCGHDYGNGNPGVDQAVNELVPGHNLMQGGSIWFKEML